MSELLISIENYIEFAKARNSVSDVLLFERVKSALEQATKDKAELHEGFLKAVTRLQNCSGFYEGSPSNKRDLELLVKHSAPGSE